jgi:hypothetical protein
LETLAVVAKQVFDISEVDRACTVEIAGGIPVGFAWRGAISREEI